MPFARQPDVWVVMLVGPKQVGKSTAASHLSHRHRFTRMSLATPLKGMLSLLGCTPEHLGQARALLEHVGRVLVLDEVHQDAVTAISGSGPAYIFYVVEAMIEAGVLLGLPRDTATELVVQTLYGAATMIRETGQHPTVLREQVSSPGGTSVAALRALEDHKVRAAFITAMEAAATRSRELAGD